LDELGSIQLGDSRSNRRMVKVFSQMLNAPGKSIPQCSRSVAEAKAFYRLLDVDALTDTLLFEVQRHAVLRRAMASGCRVLLAIQDTTTCNFDTHHCLDGLGAISSNHSRADFKGLHVHSTQLSAADEDASSACWEPSSTPARRFAKSRPRARAIVNASKTRRACAGWGGLSR
jgi:hypothetical protein